MNLRMMARLSLICLLILPLLAACAPDTPTPEPTVTLFPTLFFTDTPMPEPTETLAPTADPNQAALTGTAPANAPEATAGAGGTAAAPTSAPANPAGGTGLGRGPEKYEFLGQDVPDNTQFLPNRQVTVTWTIKNTGTTGWTKEYMLRYFSGPKAQKDLYTFTKDVPANATINFVITFTTPADPATYDMWFKLTNPQGQNFGDLDLVYTVSNSPVKATNTPAK